MKALVLNLDGYEDWVPVSEEIVELESFTKEGVLNFLKGEDSEEFESLEDFGDAIQILKNSITVNNEEGGTIFIKLG